LIAFGSPRQLGVSTLTQGDSTSFCLTNRFISYPSATHARNGVAQEWLRREGRRVDAREQLRLAHERYTRDGHGGFREGARRELVATGDYYLRAQIAHR
jgi:hypothetical protein